MLTRTGLHAIRAMAVLARLPAGEYVGASRIAGEIDAPANYLGKLLQNMTRDGLVESQKGSGGGFRLARPSKGITLFEIVDPIENFSRWSGCILGRKECSEVDPCVVHERWKKVRSDYLALLQRTTVAEIVKGGEPALNSLA